MIIPVLEENMHRKISRAADITRLYTHVCTLKLQVVSTVVPAHTNNNRDCAFNFGTKIHFGRARRQGVNVRSLGGGGLTWRAIVTLVREMRDHCRVDFIGLTRTVLVDADFEELATGLESLPAPSQGGRSPEVLELLRMDASADVRRRLVKAGEDAGVKVLMSRVGGPAL